jgi:hypothetical protein
MKKIIFFIIILANWYCVFGQPKNTKLKEDYKSVQDAVNFLNKTFKANQGLQEIKVSVGANTPSYLSTTRKIDNISVTPDSDLIIEYTVAHGESGEDGVIYTTDRYASVNQSSILVELRYAGLIAYFKVNPPQDKTDYPDGIKSEVVNIAFNTNRYDIISRRVVGTSLKPGETMRLLLGKASFFTISDYLSNKNIDDAIFNERAKKVADAFNYIIRHNGGGRD